MTTKNQKPNTKNLKPNTKNLKPQNNKNHGKEKANRRMRA